MIICTLGEIMEKRGLSNKDVVELTGVSRNTIKGFQSDASKRIDYETLDKFCEGLNLTPGELLKYIENAPARD
ncbi:XRE family transcriptional regulator [Alkalihalophilus pseudofirmus OF4]|uniref:XRE family transcriptional regulator n=1 Tax=Alkalihalophilus pseudofirmus (strain ATCC BAA-2126 / JCM 17055 / OF4) TaxID=398511 RepID=D3FYT3_ALKPO|nr:helix-turn-helix transcriptional regulator [Alkalihalophilus pseudofirmus]ADC48966.1 XRE family transcriptional regulator [Alkalihalophilus pseudofirmus OF4]